MSDKLNEFSKLVKEAKAKKKAETMQLMTDVFKTVVEAKKEVVAEKEEKAKSLSDLFNAIAEAKKVTVKEPEAIVEETLEEVVETINEIEEVVEEIKEKSVFEDTLEIINTTKHIDEADEAYVRMFNTMKDDIDNLKRHINALPNRITQMIGTSAGSGEVRLRYLDDVDRNTIAGGYALYYNADTKKFEFVYPGQKVYIQDTQPVTPDTKYLWIQTNINGNPEDFTFWIEDGL